MRKFVRFVGTAVAGLIGLVVGCLLSGVEGIDRQPYLDASYYTQTVERLRVATNQALTVTGPLDAGFGRASLTPTLNVHTDDAFEGLFTSLPLAGYGNRQGRPATGVHDELWAKAIAVRVGDRVAVWVGADTLIIPPEVADGAVWMLTQDLGLTREQVYFGATHTHAGPGGWGQDLVTQAFAGPFHPEVRVWMVRQLVAAVKAAIADLRPASFGQGRVEAPEFVRNRLVGQRGSVDPEFSFACFRQAGGASAVLGSYAAHATVLSGENMEFSGDYPGYWQREVEVATGGMAVFLAGGVGSHSPRAGGGGFEGAERMGRALARRVVEALPRVPLTNTVSLGLLGCTVDLPEVHARLTDAWRLRPGLAQRLLPVRSQTFLQALRLGEAVWVSTPCDFSGELALEFKYFMRAHGREAVVTSFNGDYLGYVIPARYYHLGGYEPRLMSFFGPCLPDYLSDLMRKMSLRVAP